MRQVRLRVLIEGGRSWEKTATLKEPVGWRRLVAALADRLEAVELPGPAEALALHLAGLTAPVAPQAALPGFLPRRPLPLVEAVRQLKRRYGASPIYRVAEVEPWSRIPERRHALVSYDP